MQVTALQRLQRMQSRVPQGDIQKRIFTLFNRLDAKYNNSFLINYCLGNLGSRKAFLQSNVQIL